MASRREGYRREGYRREGYRREGYRREGYRHKRLRGDRAKHLNTLFRELKQIKKISTCFFSAFIFLTNCATALWVNNMVYFGLFTTLFVTSLIVHTDNNIYTNLLDKIPILGVVSYGGYLFWKKLGVKSHLKGLIPVTFLAVIFLYCYGYLSTSYCFNKNKEMAELYHALLHLISSVGHHLIMII